MGDGRPGPRRDKAKKLFHKDLLLPTISSPWNQPHSHRRRSFSPPPQFLSPTANAGDTVFRMRGGTRKSPALIEPAVRLGKEPWDQFTRRRPTLLEEAQGNTQTDWMQGGREDTGSPQALSPSVELIHGVNNRLPPICADGSSSPESTTASTSPDGTTTHTARSLDPVLRKTVKKLQAIVELHGDLTGATLDGVSDHESEAGSHGGGSPGEMARRVPMQGLEVVQRLQRQLERRTVKIDDPNSKFTREEMRSFCSSLRGEGTVNLLKRTLRASSIPIENRSLADLETLVEFFGKCSALKDCNGTERFLLARSVHPRLYTAGEDVFHDEFQPHRMLVLILQGEVEVVTPGGAEAGLGRLGSAETPGGGRVFRKQGEFLGDMTLKEILRGEKRHGPSSPSSWRTSDVPSSLSPPFQPRRGCTVPVIGCTVPVIGCTVPVIGCTVPVIDEDFSLPRSPPSHALLTYEAAALETGLGGAAGAPSLTAKSGIASGAGGDHAGGESARYVARKDVAVLFFEAGDLFANALLFEKVCLEQTRSMHYSATFLGSLDLFRDWAWIDLVLLASEGVSGVQVDPGVEVFRAGAPVEGVHVIQTGECKIELLADSRGGLLGSTEGKGRRSESPDRKARYGKALVANMAVGDDGVPYHKVQGKKVALDEKLHLMCGRTSIFGEELVQDYQRTPEGKLSVLPAHTYSLRSLTACGLLFFPASVVLHRAGESAYHLPSAKQRALLHQLSLIAEIRASAFRSARTIRAPNAPDRA